MLGPEIGRGRYGHIYQATGQHVREMDVAEVTGQPIECFGERSGFLMLAPPLQQVAVRTCDLPAGRKEHKDFIDIARVMRLYAVPHHVNVCRAVLLSL